MGMRTRLRSGINSIATDPRHPADYRRVEHGRVEKVQPRCRTHPKYGIRNRRRRTLRREYPTDRYSLRTLTRINVEYRGKWLLAQEEHSITTDSRPVDVVVPTLHLLDVVIQRIAPLVGHHLPEFAPDPLVDVSRRFLQLVTGSRVQNELPRHPRKYYSRRCSCSSKVTNSPSRTSSARSSRSTSSSVSVSGASLYRGMGYPINACVVPRGSGDVRRWTPSKPPRAVPLVRGGSRISTNYQERSHSSESVPGAPPSGQP